MFSRKKRTKIFSTVSTPSWWKMVFNKIRRSYLCYFEPEYVKENEAARVGECFGCGKCCTLVFKCVFLTGSEEQARCQIYEIGRPKPCGAFPIDPRDLADVNFLCGYSFATSRTTAPVISNVPPIEAAPPMEPAFHLIRKIEPASKASDRGRLRLAPPAEGATQAPLIEINLISE